MHLSSLITRKPAGDLLYWETPGGGGYGEPLQRDPAAVMRDLKLGLVSPGAARETYDVLLTDKGELDESATAARRKRLTEGVA